MSDIQHIYCISGLGADHRIFSNLILPKNTVIHHLPWFDPQKNETIESYAARMAEDIHSTMPVLMGVSFGGMISVEISKLMPVSKTILISSIKSKEEKPFYFRAAASLKLNKIISLKPFGFLEPIENYNLGVQSEEEKILAREYRKNINMKFTNWAVDRIINWKNEEWPGDIIHINGDNDHIFPIKYIEPTNIIKGGGHMMVMNRANEISSILAEHLLPAN